MKTCQKTRKTLPNRSGAGTYGNNYQRHQDENGQWWIEDHGTRWRSLVDWQLWNLVRQLIPSERPQSLGIIGTITVPGIDESWTVELVDGDQVNLIEGFDNDERPPMDFNQGANFKEARWCPDKRVILDDRVRWDQQCFTLYHECGETRYMILDKYDYDTAHVKINKEEKELREIYSELRSYERQDESEPARRLRELIKDTHSMAGLAALAFELNIARFSMTTEEYDELKAELEDRIKRRKHPWVLLGIAGLGALGLARILEKREERFDRAIRSGLSNRIDAVLEDARRTGATSVADTFDAGQWNDVIRTIARDNLKSIVGEGSLAELETNLHGRIKTIARVQEIMPRGKLPLNIQSGAKAFLDESLNQPWWNDHGQEVKNALAKSIADGINAGAGPDALQSRIKGVLGDMAKTQADRIARTETTGAFNAGAGLTRQHLADLGLITYMKWRAIWNGHHPTTRPSHKKAHGQTVPIGSSFLVGGHTCRYPGDYTLPASERINCRCLAIGVKE